MSRTPPLAPTIHAAFCLVLAGICAALHIWKLPPALPALQVELGIDLVESGFLLSIVQFGGMTLGLLVGLVAERIGLRRCVLIGLAILAASSAAGAYFDTVGMIMLFRALEGCGFLMVVMPVPSLIRQLVPPGRLNRIMTLWSCYMPAGSVLILLTGPWLLRLGDWRMLWIFLAVLTVAMLYLVWAMVPSDSQRAQQQSTQRQQAETRPSILHMVRLTLSSRDVWIIALIFGAYAAQWVALIGFLPTIYAAAGIQGTTAGFLTALVAGVNIIGNLMAGRLLHHGLTARRLIVTGLCTMMVCTFLSFGAGLPMPVQFAAILVFSAVGGLIPATLFVLAIRVAPSPQTTTTTVGWMQQCSSLGQFVGPPVIAWVVDLAGGWQWTWLATGAYALTGILLALSLSRRAEPSA